MLKSKVLKWIKDETEKLEERLDDYTKEEDRNYNLGYLYALENIETVIGYGTFDENVYVKLKKDIKVENLKNDIEYHAICVDAGRFFKIYIDEIGEVEKYSRELFDIIRVE